MSTKGIFKVLMFVILLSVSTPCMYAQDSQNKNLHFVYVDHEVNTPVNQLCRQLKSLRDDALETGDVLIVYMSTGLRETNYGLQSYTNIADINSMERDTEEAFNNIIAAMQNANSHNVEPRQDVMNILKIFSDYNFQNEDSSLKYANVIFDFYVGSRFWKLGNNERVISHLYADLDIQSFSKNRCSFNVYQARGDKVASSNTNLFGRNNIQDINNKVKLLEY